MSLDTKVKLDTTRIFAETISANSRYVVNRGGGGSGKTIAALQVLISKFLSEKNKRILIIRKTLPSLRDSTHTAFLEILESLGIKERIKEEKQYLNYFYGTNEIRFRSLDNPDKIKSAEYNYIFLEEATELSYNDFEMLDMYMRKPSQDGKRNQMYLNFNPISIYHWLKTKLIDIEEDLVEIVSNYKDNPFLSDDHRHKLESLINRDPNLYRVYTLGEWGIASNLVFNNWKVVEAKSVDLSNLIEACYGMDFGFNDPTVIIQILQEKEDKLKLHIRQIMYKSGLINSVLIEKMDKVIDRTKYIPIYADSAEPDRIKEMRKAGWNVKPAKKGKNSIKDSIDTVKKYDLIIHDDATEVIKEAQSYCWQTDRDGDPIDKPIETNNHAMDGIRYGIHTGLGKPDIKFRWF